MFAYCRTKPIRSVQYLSHQSRHARREDETSRPRIRRDASPGTSLSWSCDDAPKPDYATSFRAFKKANGVSERKGAQIGLHMLVGISPEWVKEAGDIHDPANPRNVQLLHAARAWADMWSGGGCYAARLDLDETGGAVVDLFIAPTAEQKHKSGKAKLTVSVNKALESLAVQHTGKKGKHYAALNTSWAEYARAQLDRRIERGRPKDETGVQHVGPDQYRAMMADATSARDAARKAEARAIQAEKLALEKLKAAEGAVMIAAQVGAAVITGGLARDDAGNWKINKDGPSKDTLRPVWSIIRPALDVVADWWQRVRSRVEVLPDPNAEIEALSQIYFDPFASPPEDARQQTGPGI